MPISSIPKPYESVLPELQTRLKEEQDKGYNQAISQDELQVVISIFRFAETNRPPTGFGMVSKDEIDYRAEYNTWCYYCE